LREENSKASSLRICPQPFLLATKTITSVKSQLSLERLGLIEERICTPKPYAKRSTKLRQHILVGAEGLSIELDSDDSLSRELEQ
jgi:hypothetical protein